MEIYPWLVSHERQGQRLEDFPNLARWYEKIAARPAVQRALEVGSELRRPIADLDEKARDTLLGNRGRAKG
jgi:GST-like protein